MQKQRLAFKTTQIFDWETEPKEERPSGFESTGFATASGYYPSLDPVDAARRRSGPKGGGLLLFLGLILAIAAGTVGLFWLPRLLQG